MQFLIESALISVIGGFIGVAVGVLGTMLLSKIAGWATVVNPLAGALSLCTSAGIGIFFGLYPAQKAAALHPIDALTYE
jgi:ABC-type antimicrobial peptide transport system permease subunit